ncbi:MAG: VCBS repeat-containing protein [Candidatus Midichloria sp.]|nr:MAG: VCBS repeat-containing protein [Candidatus Midichloria sp.]
MNNEEASIVSFNSFSNYLAILLGKGDGTFQAKRNYTISDNNTILVAVGDFNGDGKLNTVNIPHYGL